MDERKALEMLADLEECFFYGMCNPPNGISKTDVCAVYTLVKTALERWNELVNQKSESEVES